MKIGPRIPSLTKRIAARTQEALMEAIALALDAQALEWV